MMERPNDGHRNPNFLHGQSLLSAIQHPVNESYQVDIKTKTRTEIVELLERQEKLLANKQFLSKLPDGGKKIEIKASQLKTRLQEIDAESNSNVELQTCTMAVENENEYESSAKDEEMLEIQNGCESGDAKKMNVDELKIVERGFNEMSIHEGPFYDVVKQANTKQSKSKFVLNRQLEKESQHLGENSVSQIKLSAPTTRAESPVTEQILSPKSPSPGKLTKLISVDECRTLHMQQQAIVKKQQAELAAERLLAKYGGGGGGLTMENSHSHTQAHPEGVTDFQHEETSDNDEDEVVVHMDDLDLDDVD